VGDEVGVDGEEGGVVIGAGGSSGADVSGTSSVGVGSALGVVTSSGVVVSGVVVSVGVVSVGGAGASVVGTTDCSLSVSAGVGTAGLSGGRTFR
jgi:hypothetical protein